MTIKTPWIAGHRGGANIYPEHSLEGYKATVASGYLPEIDLRKLADGSFAVLHDATVNRTMTGVSGDVSNLTRAQFKRGKVKNPIPGGDYGTPLLWDEVLDLFGGHGLLVEAKNPAEAAEIIATINARGLQGSIILSSFDYNSAVLIADAGLVSLYLVQGSVAQTPAQIKAAGIEYIGISRGTAQSSFAAFKAAGLKMATWTVEDPIQGDFDTDRGAVGLISDDPWYVSGHNRVLTADPYAKRFAYPGWQEGVTAADVADGNTGRLWSFQDASRGKIAVKRNPVANRTRSLTQTWAGTINGDFKIRATFDYGSNCASDTRWLGMFVGCGKGKAVVGPDAVWRDESSPTVSQQYGYGVLWRRNGQMSIYRNDNGAPLLLGSIETTPVGSGGRRKVEFKRVGNTFTATDLASDTQLVVASGTYGGDQFFALAANGTSGFVSGVSVS